jgi:aconitate hydratase
MQPHHAEIGVARAIGLFGDSITTDHISPAGAIKRPRPRPVAEGERRRQGRLQLLRPRRGNHDVMMRGTFANVRIRT